jgi:acrylyl-CoA reductase (NADPH)
MLARVLGQMKYGGSVAAVGLAGGAAARDGDPVPPARREPSGHRQRDAALREPPARLGAGGRDVPRDKLEAMIQPAGLGICRSLGAAILKGGVRGRVVVDVRS